jgi:hypothetical protein
MNCWERGRAGRIWERGRPGRMLEAKNEQERGL